MSTNSALGRHLLVTIYTMENVIISCIPSEIYCSHTMYILYLYLSIKLHLEFQNSYQNIIKVNWILLHFKVFAIDHLHISINILITCSYIMTGCYGMYCIQWESDDRWWLNKLFVRNELVYRHYGIQLWCNCNSNLNEFLKTCYWRSFEVLRF